MKNRYEKPEFYIDTSVWGFLFEDEAIDGILSWNMKHIVKFSTRRIVTALCHLKGYKEIEILSPEEVIYER